MNYDIMNIWHFLIFFRIIDMVYIKLSSHPCIVMKVNYSIEKIIISLMTIF